MVEISINLFHEIIDILLFHHYIHAIYFVPFYLSLGFSEYDLGFSI